MNYNLYYLVDQSGDINGDKTLVGAFPDLAAAQAQAINDSVQHYSVERDNRDGTFTIVYVI